MSFLDRSVPLKYAILGAIALAVFAGVAVHQLRSRSDSIAHYGEARPAEVVKADDPKTVGSIFGLWGETYTNTKVKVISPSGEPWYYSNVPLGGRAVIGQELNAWLYDGNPERAYFSGWFDTNTNEAQATPWPSAESEWFLALFAALAAALVTFIILKILSPRKPKKRRPPASPGRKSATM